MAAGEQSTVWNGAFPGEASMERRQCMKCGTNSQDCYWQHAGDSKKSFLHFFQGNWSSSSGLERANYSGSFYGLVSDVVRIYMRSGDFDNVTANRRGSLLCILDNGWDLICKDHGIFYGDYGVFTYRGPSEIRLRLFDKTGVEKHSTFMICSGNHYQQALGCSDKRRSLDPHKMLIVGRNVALRADLLSGSTLLDMIHKGYFWPASRAHTWRCRNSPELTISNSRALLNGVFRCNFFSSFTIRWNDCHGTNCRFPL
ncbi:unnamed protein product [Urochloa humidicola]